MSDKRYYVVGAGLAGATAARSLAESGKQVTVIEQHNHIAGHCHDYRDQAGITVHTYGPHIFHTKERTVWEWVNRFTDFIYYQHKVISFADGQMIPFPINRDTICQLFGVDISIDEVPHFLRKQVENSRFNDPPENFADAVISQVGEVLYRTFFENYTRKQWGRDPRELSSELAKRIPVRSSRDARYFSDPYQGIPARGYTAMVQNILDHKNISLMLNTDYFSIKDEIKGELTVYTGELDRYFEYESGKLEYRSLDLRFETYDTPEYQQAAVVNYPNDYQWTRITEFKKLSGELSDKTTVCFEFPKASGEPYYIVPDARNSELKETYMKKVRELEESKEVLFIGRLAEYAYYNMDQVIAATLKKIEPFI